jgi:exodeoxyribonuclease V alpha subunit
VPQVAVQRGGNAEFVLVELLALTGGQVGAFPQAVGFDSAGVSISGQFRVLCAHRRGPYGVATWAARIEDWLAIARPGLRPHGSTRAFAGQALLLTANDPELRLFNGDTGVVVTDGKHLRAAFERAEGTMLVSPSRLSAYAPLHAMTVHKAQGSQVGTAAVLLPEPTSRLLTRELLYTAATRASDELVVVGPESAVLMAMSRPAGRASGLRDRLV